ncbi:phosphoglycerate kinase [Candidatus Peribacteria bacterium RIFOXYC1_FULL_54_13]|nr:MAG: Phosphoglycerate kinase [Candidatus Peribacteria bacterium GW2011_GWB1_54_5]OGJ72049.1 MAG: phosphoglycerate kinase [Candidatus Peribacteria bacterium RIFOXYA1_FULL_56_14]OGJ74060.1 MAG: phosphoglycerate kinase [Candidatus Peribacteria bacterium RIFOXYA2_FULL_55_28]OGJ75491.1 MAG: phosphoglycerate kinase [Candidatus Peribacteria bacterium RIFOXYB1_FULL_54_35]OGJ76333.1 MAG: phosphoglycerate kinase [Candidatus Peribacteria bacterium RIFOXYB2_FULL_54_17]OGJ78807.1 MAG: phosphoglycerate k
MPKYPLLKDAPLKNKKVLLRAGFDVPMENGKVVDTSRIEAMVPTMKYILEKGAALIIMAHQGRPKGKADPVLSQKPLVPILKKLLKTEVDFAAPCAGEEAKKKAAALKPGQVLLLENLRFEPGEKEKKDPAFAKKLAALADLYVNDAFTNCHRDHASMTGVPELLPAYLGFQAQKEVENLSKVFLHPRHPVTLIVSGAKMETKVPVIEHFLDKADSILVGGCIANTFIAARGFDVGKSKYEEQWIEKAQEIMLESEKDGMADVLVPRDAVVATEATEKAQKLDLPVENIAGDMAIFDIGTVTVKRYVEIIEKSRTIVWNGPLGMHELNRFSHATKRIAEAIARATKKNKAVSIIGGGDTLDFHERYGYSLKTYTFVSTAGGAMMDLISGKVLPALKALEKK